MANKKISDLPAASSLALVDQIEVLQGGVSKSATIQKISGLVPGAPGPAGPIGPTGPAMTPAGAVGAIQWNNNGVLGGIGVGTAGQFLMSQGVGLPGVFNSLPLFTGSTPGLVPTGDGDATKFLNAAGAFAVPAGGGGGGTSFGDGWDWATTTTEVDFAFPTAGGNWLSVSDDGTGNGNVQLQGLGTAGFGNIDLLATWNIGVTAENLITLGSNSGNVALTAGVNVVVQATDTFLAQDVSVYISTSGNDMNFNSAGLFSLIAETSISVTSNTQSIVLTTAAGPGISLGMSPDGDFDVTAGRLLSLHSTDDMLFDSAAALTAQGDTVEVTSVGNMQATSGNNLTVAAASQASLTANNIVLSSASILDLNMTQELNINSDPGTAGQVLTSQGAGLPPIWA